MLPVCLLLSCLPACLPTCLPACLPGTGTGCDFSACTCSRQARPRSWPGQAGPLKEAGRLACHIYNNIRKTRFLWLDIFVHTVHLSIMVNKIFGALCLAYNYPLTLVFPVHLVWKRTVSIYTVSTENFSLKYREMIELNMKQSMIVQIGWMIFIRRCFRLCLLISLKNLMYTTRKGENRLYFSS